MAERVPSALPAIPEQDAPNWSRDLIKQIAMDIGKETVAYIQVMYPEAIDATSSTFKLSVRNTIYNNIMAAIEITDEESVIARLKERKTFRRQWVAAWRKLRRDA